MKSVWDSVDMKWPVYIGAQKVCFSEARRIVDESLNRHDVSPLSFSHYGVVVASIESTCAAIHTLYPQIALNAQKTWVESYQVFVFRMDLEGTELELIEPAGNGFFNTFLENEGEGLHHIAFQIANIENSLNTLENRGMELLDSTPRRGSHGKVAFAQSLSLAPLHLELCELR